MRLVQILYAIFVPLSVISIPINQGITNNGIQLVDLGTILILKDHAHKISCNLEINGNRALCTKNNQDIPAPLARFYVKTTLEQFLPGAKLEHYKLQNYKNILDGL